MAERKLACYTKNDLSNKTDNELVSLAKNGDEEALEYLFNKYKELVNMKVFYNRCRKRRYCAGRYDWII